MAERKGGEEWIRHVDYCVRCDAKTADNKVGLRNEANWGANRSSTTFTSPEETRVGA